MILENFINKWIMRIKEARTVLVVGLWSVMAMVQVLGFVRPYLNAVEMIAAAGFMAFSGIAFTYLYDKLEIMKGEHRQRARRKNNFVGENMVLSHLGMIHIFSEAFEKDPEEMMERYSEFLEEYKDGVHLDSFGEES
jgi:hypothetical protein